MKNFIKTLLWRDLLPLALAVYFGTVLQGFLESLVSHVIIPALAYFLPLNLGEQTHKKIDYKELITKSITMIIAVLIIYTFVKLIIKYVE